MSRDFTSAWLANRLAKQAKPSAETGRVIAKAVESEFKLHQAIMAYCDSQWPKWVYVHSRMDDATTQECGVADFIIFAPHKVLCIECKAKYKKQSDDQRVWETRVNAVKNPNVVYKVVWCMEEFLEVVK